MTGKTIEKEKCNANSCFLEKNKSEYLDKRSWPMQQAGKHDSVLEMSGARQCYPALFQREKKVEIQFAMFICSIEKWWWYIFKNGKLIRHKITW